MTAQILNMSVQETVGLMQRIEYFKYVDTYMQLKNELEIPLFFVDVNKKWK